MLRLAREQHGFSECPFNWAFMTIRFAAHLLQIGVGGGVVLRLFMNHELAVFMLDVHRERPPGLPF